MTPSIAYEESTLISVALSEIWKLIGDCNRYIDITQPWVLAKDEALKPRLVLRGGFKVVLQHDGLPIQAEQTEVFLCFHYLQQLVQRFCQAKAHGLKGLVPFPVPVGAGKEEDLKRFVWLYTHERFPLFRQPFREPIIAPCTKYFCTKG